MGKGKRRAGLHICMQVIRVNGGLMLVRRQHHQDIGPRCGIGIGQDLEASGFGLFRGGRSSTQRNGYVRNAAVAQVLGMCMALATITNNRDFLVLDQAQIAICVVKYFHVLVLLLCRHPECVSGSYFQRRNILTMKFSCLRLRASGRQFRFCRLQPGRLRASTRRTCRSCPGRRLSQK